MSIKPLNIETVFAGGIHLIWLTLLVLSVLGKSPDIIFSYLSNIESGTAVLLVAVLFSVAFFIGRIGEHFVSAINYFIHKNKRKLYVDTFAGETGEVWANKIFTFSASIGLIFSIVTLFITIENTATKKAILIIGIILLIGTLSSFLYWYSFGKRLGQRRTS